MRTEDIPTKTPEPWLPERNAETLALCLKLAEECNELAARLCRAGMQGWRELDPGDGRTNAAHVWDEMADVEALMDAMRRRLSGVADRSSMQERCVRKFHFKAPWFAFLRNKRLVVSDGWTTPDE